MSDSLVLNDKRLEVQSVTGNLENFRYLSPLDCRHILGDDRNNLELSVSVNQLLCSVPKAAGFKIVRFLGGLKDKALQIFSKRHMTALGLQHSTHFGRMTRW